jgi:hypothetical protein
VLEVGVAPRHGKVRERDVLARPAEADDLVGGHIESAAFIRPLQHKKR